MNKILKKVVSSITVFGILAYTMPVFALVNSETVYTKLNSQGENYKTIVMTKSGEDVEEKETEKELPIETKITYALDGEEISQEELAGKSGKVNIKIEYTNKSEKQVYVNGKYQTMYTPFVVMTGTIIDNENNKNIEVKNGKVIENGNKSIVVGLSLPGMKESLNLSGELSSINIPSSVEISMDTTNFSMKNIVTYATPKVLDEDINWSKLDKLFDDVNELQDGANKLEDGTNELRDGAIELNDGANKLAGGASELANGTDELYKTISEKIGELKKLEGEYTDKEKLSSEIAKIINQKLQDPEIMAELKTLAEKEAINTVRNNKTELENAVISTSVNYTNNVINEKVKEIENGKLLEDELETELIKSLKEDIENIFKDIESDEITKNLKEDLKQAMLAEVTNVVGEKTEYVVKTQVNAMKEKDFSQAEKEGILTQASGMVLALRAQGYTEEQAQIAVLNFAKAVSNNTLDSVSKQSKSISNSVINLSATELNKVEQADIDEALKIYQDKISTVIISSLANSLDTTNPEILKQVEKSIKDKMIKAITSELGKDKVLTAEIDKVVQDIAKQVAYDYTEKLSLEMVNNIIAEQLSTEIKSSVINKELTKYETMINKELNTLNSTLDTLENALYRVNDGAQKLRNGTSELSTGTSRLLEGTNTLADGMHKFNSEGINKIYNLANVDLYNLKIRGQKLEGLSKEYVSFDSEENLDNIKFISIIDSVKTSEKNETKEEMLLPNTDVTIKSEE